MTVRIRAARAEATDAWRPATGTTLPHAVREAVRKLGIGPGRTVRSWEDPPQSGQWFWNWSGTLLRITVLDEFGRSNCGAGSVTLCKAHPGVCDACCAASYGSIGRGSTSFEGGPQRMTLTLSPEAIEELDRGATVLRLDRSTYIETLLMRERAAFRSALGKKNIREMLRKHDCRCGAHPDQLHKPGCDVERCALCGGQTIACTCVYTMTRKPLPWEGYYPGTAECVELGWFTRYVDASGQPAALPSPGGKSMACEAADAYAQPDFSRLDREAQWDKQKCRFVVDESHARK